jgi:glutathione peroxidase
VLVLSLFLAVIDSLRLTPINFKSKFSELLKTTLIITASIGFLSTPISIAADTSSINSYMVSIEGSKKPMMELLGKKATLVVNVASQCALTPQYEELVELHDKYSSKGFQILAFPCNQFGSQEPAEDAQIRKDMAERFNVKFPILDKIDVNGFNEDPLYTKLKSYPDISVSKIGKISWNFEKFLINSEGVPVRRYKPGILPLSIEGDVKELIEQGKLSEKKRASLNDY